MPVIDIDHGWTAFGQLMQDMSGDPHVLVGVQGAEGAATHPGSALTNAELATIHEYGLGVPQRSFLRRTLIEDQHAIADMFARLGSRVLQGQITVAYAFALVGEYVVGRIKDRIISHIPPPNAPETIAKKKSSTPLIDKQHLMRSITYKLVR